MKQTPELFQKKLETHKKILSMSIREQNKPSLEVASIIGKELALVYSEYKCSKCKKETKLQYHHLINRKMKDYMDYWKYVSQRHYWANIIVLCMDCHAELEGRKIDLDDLPLCIPQENIEDTKARYERYENYPKEMKDK